MKSGELLYDLTAMDVEEAEKVTGATESLQDTRISNPGQAEGSPRKGRIEQLKEFVNSADEFFTVGVPVGLGLG